MDVTPLIRKDQQVIQSYSGGKFRVSGEIFEGPILVFSSHTEKWDVTGDVAAQSFEILAAQAKDIDVVLWGTGKNMQIIRPELRKQLKDMGLTVESMDTGAACRTYNVLMAEGRRVAAALLPVL